ncbi:MAG: adenylosuccinate synthase [Deltaproteobacteria bacterium]|nr:adenylosuccinate synthase [Deltaproteobacteria bacterium]
MANIAVLGAQWGDEGKGKIVDLYGERADLIVRYQGGNNAGHTLVVGGEKTVLHLIPSGVLHPGKTCVIASGVVLDPEVFLREVEALTARGLISESRGTRVWVSERTQVIMPYHKLIDRLREESGGKAKIGTTVRGIGPCYEDKVARRGVMVGDLMDSDLLRDKIEAAIREKNAVLAALYNHEPLVVEELHAWALEMGKKLKPMVRDTRVLIQEAIAAGNTILFEGAQGTLLDVEHGTYPFVTSSNTITGGIFTGCGIGPKSLDRIIGISKAYTTRVGGGPFPTELDNDLGEWIRKQGQEFGATTGRPRRCGWLDLVALKYAVEVNGLTGIALMKADVLSGLEELKVCVAYEVDGARRNTIPSNIRELERVKPVYESLKGWKTLPDRPKTFGEMPDAFRAYVGYIERTLGIPVVTISTGPGREQTLNR